ncbi:hypothetical protein IFM89_010751 [Coptis chinensis]|uniref:Uncharacterized protein n=1 Tax=Coptis chinensis TaxID=261450 RepID=A0A835ILD7_9MAGN|nr:hypothetical protein IFM89_010751 [Coptis chinensis]
MPTFTSSVTLDRFLEPGEAKSTKRNMPTMEKKIFSPKASPSLYTTDTDVRKVSESLFSFPPPNGERHEMSPLKTLSQGDDSLCQEATQREVRNGSDTNGKAMSVTLPLLNRRDEVTLSYDKFNGFHNGKANNINLDGNGDSSMLVAISPDRDAVSEDFFDPQESMSVTSSVDTEDNIGSERTLKLTTPMAEFYDAYEELSTEGGRQTPLRDVEAELREIRLNLLMEIEVRKQAEETVEIMKSRWQRLGQRLALEGLTLPAVSTITVEDEKLEFDHAEELCQQISFAHAVSTSIGRVTAKAEAEMELEAKIELKDSEISRLRQRLHYYETVNREMSLRNQEAIEMAHRLRQSRKRKQRWIWSSVGVTFMLGSATLAWSFLSSTEGSPSTDPSHVLVGDTAANELPN